MTHEPAVDYRRCVRCVMDTTDPQISFDEAGVCSHCHRFDAQFAERVRAAAEGRRVDDFRAIAERIRESGEGKEYDCVVGMSGGVDSTYVLLKAREFGLRPLAVHFDSGWNSEIAVANIERATRTLDVDLKTDVVNWPEMRDLQLAFFKAGVTNCDIPTDHAFPAVALREAAAYGLKYVLSGGNLATESILPKAWGHNAADLRYLRSIHRAHGKVKLKTYPQLGILRKQVWYQSVRGIKTVRILDYLPYDKAEAKRRIAEELGWRDYGGKHHESVFTRFFQGYYLPVRFGYDKRLAHLSSLVLAGQMTREDALQELETQPTYDPELQLTDLRFVAKKLGLAERELTALIERPLHEIREYATNDTAYRVAMQARDRLARR